MHQSPQKQVTAKFDRTWETNLNEKSGAIGAESVVKRGKRTSGGVSEGLPGIYFAEILGFATLRPNCREIQRQHQGPRSRDPSPARPSWSNSNKGTKCAIEMYRSRLPLGGRIHGFEATARALTVRQVRMRFQGQRPPASFRLFTLMIPSDRVGPRPAG